MGRPRTCSHADLTPTRVCRLEYPVPSDFLDLRIFVKFSSIQILRFSTHLPETFALRLQLSMRFRISRHQHQDFSRNFLPPARPLSLERVLFVDHFTPRTARPYLAPRWLYASVYIRMPRARWHIPPVHAHTVEHREKERKRKRMHIHIHKYRHTAGYTLGARARIYSHATDARRGCTDDDAATELRPAAQRRRCMHLPKAVCDEGGVGGGGYSSGDGTAAVRRRALYRMENARTGFGPQIGRAHV